MAKFKILSLDGGGIRGTIPASILLVLENKLIQQTGNPDTRIADHFDLIAGTSAGGILSYLYLLPDRNCPSEHPRPKYSAQAIVNLFMKLVEAGFSADLFHKMRTAGGLLDEKYSTVRVEKLMRQEYGDTKLSQLIKPCLITSYEIGRGRPHFFTQHDARANDRHDFWVRDVSLATSAAPTFFEVANRKSMAGVNHAFIDGAVFANNPSLCAYAEVHSKFHQTLDGFKLRNEGTGEKISANDMALLSLGTGQVHISYEYEKVKDWGLVQWPGPLIEIMMEGVSATVDYQLRQIFDTANNPKQYLRLNPLVTDPDMLMIDNCSPENMTALQAVGKRVAEENSEQLDYFVDLLLEA